VNYGKTKVIEFGTRGVGKVQVYWKGERLEEVEEYKYLGMLVEKGGAVETQEGDDAEGKESGHAGMEHGGARG